MKESKHEVVTHGENHTTKETNGFKRRDILKSLVSLPVFGVFLYEILKKLSHDRRKKNDILSELGVDEKKQTLLPKPSFKNSGKLIKVGIIGFGARGEQLARSLGFAHPTWIEAKRKAAQQNKMDNTLKYWVEQENLNVAITGICDVFDLRAERGLVIAQNEFGPGGASVISTNAKRYRTYHEMLESSEIDAVIITTPDFHHAQMTIDAVNAGKHVYCEKCMTRTEDEVYRVVEAVKNAEKNNNIVFQLGHQYHQSYAFPKAKEIVKKNILGKITLVETTSNRNTPNGAWIRHLDSNGNPKPGDPNIIDWEQWLGSSPKVPFSIDRFYNWTKWWDYATGLSGQLFSHEYDAVNQILELGIPKYCTASGGIYFYKDNREIPDIFHAVFEFPDKDLTLIYSASLASSLSRGRIFMGHDGAMEVGADLKVMVDRDSTRFKEKIEQGIIDTSLPLFTYQPGLKGINAVTSATERYYLTRGLTYTYKDGKQIDISHLHLKEWLDCIRNGGTPSSDINKGFEVTIACHMATKSYREKRRVEWDPIKQRII
ncbi:MAG: Gfo/Idh/MocA family oxidoreductase [bacterium]|nr:MAG: Gfo/Idh/MocA family oxidoreductase [bacterium]